MTCDKQIEALEAQGLKVIRKPWTDADLASIGIRRDATLPEGIGYTHRHGAEADIYFLCNPTEKAMTFVPKFRATGKNIYIADPRDGKIYNGKGTSMTLKPGESTFVIITDQSIATSEDIITSQTTQLKNKGWTVKFEETGKVINTNNLFDWSQSADNDVKYYSGHATYETTFKYKGKKKGKVMLNLGNVENIATVYVNGNNCGTA